MTRSPTFTPPSRRVAAFVVFTAMMALADVWLVAWFIGSMWGMAVAAGSILGLMVWMAWIFRRYRRH